MNNKRDENKKILHNNFLNKNRKGLSAIIITLIIVGLSLVAVGIVWGVVSNLLQSSEEQTTSQYDTLFLDMKVEKVALEDEGISVIIRRGSGGGTISGVAITISDGENTKVIKREVSDFEQLEQKTFSITSSEMGDVVFVKSVSVSPLLQNSVGNVLDSLDVVYFSSCLSILNSGNSKGDGLYVIDVDKTGPENPFRVYCDMTTDGGGWTLVWSNLRERTNKPVTSLSWEDAVNTLPKYSGDFSNDLEKFDFFLGLKYWEIISQEGELMYYWKPNYGTIIAQSFVAKFSLDDSDYYKISFTDYVQKVGSQTAGIYNYNNAKFSTFDSDHDTSSGNCAIGYSNTPWWYRECWSGSINGGGENSGQGYYNGAYWYSSAKQWGDVNGMGAGNGWIWVR